MKIKQMMQAVNWFAIYQNESDLEEYTRVPLVCWALLEQAHGDEIDGLILDDQNKTELARNFCPVDGFSFVEFDYMLNDPEIVLEGDFGLDSSNEEDDNGNNGGVLH